MKTNCFSVALKNMFREKGILIVRLKGSEAREEIYRCQSVEDAKEYRKRFFATRTDISFALVATETEYNNFLKNI